MYNGTSREQVHLSCSSVLALSVIIISKFWSNFTYLIIIEAEFFSYPIGHLWFLFFTLCFQECSELKVKRKIWLTMMQTNRVFQNSAEIGCHCWFSSSIVSMTVFLPISWPRTHGGKMAAPDPASHPGRKEEEQGSHIRSFPEPSPWRFMLMSHWTMTHGHARHKRGWKRWSVFPAPNMELGKSEGGLKMNVGLANSRGLIFYTPPQ